MAYLLDTNVFIEAKNRYYGFDFCPAFWNWLIAANIESKVFSIEKVGDEIKAGDDELATWAMERGSEFFLGLPLDVFPALGTVSNWVSDQNYEPAAINTFLQDADYYLVAHALVGEHEVVTHETPANSRKKVKIPNVCIGLGIKYVTPFEMLRHERARFVLGIAS